MSEYQERDIIELDNAGNYYGKHVLAMTREDLRSKSDIAAELGYRDMVIDKLTEDNKRLREILKRLKNECEMFYSEFGEPNDGNFEAAFVEVDDLLSELGGE
ncbi:TPA: hypothetical protein VGT23_001380 [Vibrio cholerae]|nr:hypothetical protein [Vibrio cholerae]HEQ3577814.1 hypothetical protein [Vibrio cholerae]